MTKNKPLTVAVVCDTYQKPPHLYHSAGDKYLRAVHDIVGALPLMVPSFMDNPLAPEDILDFFDGFLMTGGYSNIARERYGLPTAPASENQDPARDNNSIPLIKAIIDSGKPLLCICRGHQELNVAMGGTLHPRIHEVDGHFDHRANDDDPVETQYGPAHSVTLASDGLLHQIMEEDEFMVNTIHEQAVNHIGEGLKVEAVADDGTIEALSVPKSLGFALSVQWHPEWKAAENPQSVKLFHAFRNAIVADRK